MSLGRHRPRTAAVRVERQRWPMEPTLLHASQQKADEKLWMPSPPPVVVCVYAPRRGTCQQWPKVKSAYPLALFVRYALDSNSPCSAAGWQAWATPQSLQESCRLAFSS